MPHLSRMSRSVRTLAFPLTLGTLIGSAAAGTVDIQVIYSEAPGHPTAQVPGAKDLAGNPISVEFKAIEDMIISPDGMTWLLKSRNHGGSDIETQMLLGTNMTGDMLAQEGQAIIGGAPGELYDFFDGVGGFNMSGQYVYGARARNGDATIKEKVIFFDGANQTVAYTESDPVFGLVDNPPGDSGDELFGNSLNSIHLLNDGRIGFVAVTIQNISSTRRPALCYDDNSWQQSGIDDIGGGTWDSFDSNDFRTTPDGTVWVAQGDDEGSTAADDILAVGDDEAFATVVLREGEAIDKTEVICDGIFHTHLSAGGDWFARGDDPDDNDWAVRNGTLVAKTGDAITTGLGGAEHWGDIFLAFHGNSEGDWILVGNTDSGDEATNTVMVLNGTEVLVREGDPVDLDGNGLFDDDAFIGRGNLTGSAFAPNDIFLSDDGVVYFIAPLRNGAGEDLGEFGAGGEAFMRFVIGGEVCAADLNQSGNVDVNDLLLLLSDWGTDGAGSDIAEPNDIVDVSDLLGLLAAWGSC